MVSTGSCRSASLVALLLLVAVVGMAEAAGTHDVWVHNTLPTSIKCDGVEIPKGVEVKVKLTLDVDVAFAVLGTDGKWVEGKCKVPADVSKLAVVLNLKGDVEVKVAACLGGLIHDLLATVLGLVLLVIKVTIRL